MNTIAARTVAIGTALLDYSELPHSYLAIGDGFSRLSVPSSYISTRNFAGIREVTQWADAFNTEIVISMSSGMADVQTNIILGCEPVSVEASFGTAQAYELGRILQRELNHDVSIHISADDLLVAIDQAVA